MTETADYKRPSTKDERDEEERELGKLEQMILDNPNVEDHKDGTYTVTLDTPVKYGKDQLESLKSHPATGADLLAFDDAKGDVGKMFEFISSLFEIPRNVVKRLTLTDYSAVQVVAGYILGK